MSHEIRTPLNAILGFTEILRSKVDDPELSKHLTTIRHSGSALLNLINDILDLSKVEAGKLSFNKEPMSIVVVFSEITQMFSQKARENNIEIIVTLSPDIPETIFLDAGRLQQVLINLVGNAIKFTEVGHVRLSAMFKISKESNSEVGSLVILIEDTGKGIADEDKDEIFNAFSQAKGQTHAQFGGTGLGLAISKRLIEMMGGVISLTSQLHRGSVFTIVLDNVQFSLPPSQSKRESTVSSSSKSDASSQGDSVDSYEQCPALNKRQALLFVELARRGSMKKIMAFSKELKDSSAKYIGLSKIIAQHANDYNAEKLLIMAEFLLERCVK